MHMKKLFTAAVTAALVSVIFVMPVSAHGHHHGSHGHTCNYGAQIQTPSADVQNQTPDTDSRIQNSDTDTQTQNPDYDTQIQNSDTYCPVCTIEGCTEKGRHIHNDKEYCGYNHESGYCDNTCVPNNPDCGNNRGRWYYHCHDIITNM